MKLTDFEIHTVDQEIESLIFDFKLDSDFDYSNEQWWV